MGTISTLTARWADANPQVRLGQTLQRAAADSLTDFTAGVRSVDDFPGLPTHLSLTTRAMQHSWGCSAQYWARDEDAMIHAAAEATLIGDDTDTLRSRIRQLRTGTLLWTHIGAPVSREPITPGPDAYTAPAGEIVYQLHREYDSHWAPVWILTTPGLDTDEVRFAGLHSAATYALNQLDAHVQARAPHH